MPIIGQQQVEEAGDGFEKVFGLFVAIYYNYQRTPCGSSQKHRVHRLRGGRQPGEGRVSPSADAMQYVLEPGMASQFEEQVSYDRMNQGWLIISSTILVVE